MRLPLVLLLMRRADASKSQLATRLSGWRASAASAGRHTVSVAPGEDVHLSHYCAGGMAFPSLGSRTQANNAARRKELLVNGVEAHGATRVRQGDILTLQTPPPPPMTPSALRRVEKFYSELTAKPERGGRLELLLEDDDLAVVFKPPGVHSTAWAGTRKKWGELTLSDALPLLLTSPKQNGVAAAPLPSPLAVHRLDARVGGVIAVAKTHRALSGLSTLFKERAVIKVYRAIVVGDVQPWQFVERDQGCVPRAAGGGEWSYVWREASPSFDRIESSPSAPSAASRTLRVEQFNAQGQQCTTEVRVVRATPCAVHGTLTTLELRPLTGRRHQLRIACALGLGAPIVGDDLYHDHANAARAAISPAGVELPPLPPVRRRAGLFLQATELSFTHPVTGESVWVRAPEMARFEGLRARAASGAGFTNVEWEAWRAPAE